MRAVSDVIKAGALALAAGESGTTPGVAADVGSSLAVKGRRPVIEGGRVVRVESFAIASAPSSVVRMVWRRYDVIYGSSWRAPWAGIHDGELEAHWCRKLAGVHPKALAWALDQLDEARALKPGELRALCGRWPGAARCGAAQPPAPAAGPGRHAAVIRAKLAANAAARLADDAERAGGMMRQAAERAREEEALLDRPIVPIRSPQLR